MNTKTMRLPPRRDSTPAKRIERDDFVAPKPAPPRKSFKPTTTTTTPQFQAGSDNKAKAEAKPKPSNQLLAGYLAHEFLTKGTIFGQPFDPARSDAVLPPAKNVVKPGKRKRAEKDEEEEEERNNRRRYVEVASLLKGDGAHIKGIVNPTQLARFLNM